MLWAALTSLALCAVEDNSCQEKKGIDDDGLLRLLNTRVSVMTDKETRRDEAQVGIESD